MRYKVINRRRVFTYAHIEVAEHALGRAPLTVLTSTADKVHFRTDHEGCDTDAYMCWADLGTARWERFRERLFDGWRGRPMTCPGCSRRVRVYVPMHLVVEARLR